MPKPKWIEDKERDVKRLTREPNLCKDCIYFGRHIKWVKHKNYIRTTLHECDIHPGCFNTEYSICCDDFTHA